MADEAVHDDTPPSPGAAAVDQFSDGVRAAFVDATNLAVKRATRGYLVTGVVAAVVAGCISWLVASPRPATTQTVWKHADGSVETCSRTADSGPPHSVFICVLDRPGSP